MNFKILFFVLGILFLINPISAVPFYPAGDVTVHPYGNSNAYITNSDDSSISVINTTFDTVVETLSGFSTPYGATVNPSGTKVYVANFGDDTVAVIDTITNNIVATINVGNSPICIAVTPDESKAYVIDYGDNIAYVINTNTNTVIKTIAGFNSPLLISINSAGTKAYVSNSNNGTLSVIDIATNTIISTIHVGDEYSYPAGMVISPDDTKVYVTNGDYNVSIIDTNTNSVIDTVIVGRYPVDLAITHDGSKIYAANSIDGTVSVIDAITNNVTALINVGYYPTGISINQDDTKVYVANQGSDDVSIINTTTNTVISTVIVGNSPIGIGSFICPTSLPRANFTEYTPEETDNSKTVMFTDTSTGNPTTWMWDFGENLTQSNEQNPTHIYRSFGDFVIKFNVSNTAGYSTRQTIIDPVDPIFVDYDPIYLTQNSDTQPLTNTSENSPNIVIAQLPGVHTTSIGILFDSVNIIVSNGYTLGALGVLIIAAAGLLQYFGYF